MLHDASVRNPQDSSMGRFNPFCPNRRTEMQGLFDATPQDIAALKLDIARLNDSYRAGQPEVSDEQYDAMIDQLKGMLSAADHANFVRSLTEQGGEVQHPYVMGSLKKVKHGEGQLVPWLQKNNVRLLLVSEKIDGLSFVATYVNGLLVSGATRGDGTTGTAISDKLVHILPNQLNEPVTLDVRGELTLTGDDHIGLGFKNRRNGSVGIINRDKVDAKDVAKVRGFAYQIKLGHMATAPASEQLKVLRHLGFHTPSWRHIDLNHTTILSVEGKLADYLQQQKASAAYDIDGLVLSDAGYQLEDVFHPEGMVAFKVNQDAVQTTVTGIEWNVSKNGLVKPVVLVESKEIDGTTVSRVTGYNAQWLLDNGIGEGASVGIIKSGEIIPKIVEVYQAAPVVFLGECPSCGTNLDMIGVDLCCDNEACGAAGVKTVESFLSKLDIEGAKATTLENLGIRSMDDLLSWQPDTKYKSQTSLYDEILKKVFNAPADRLFAAMLFDGFGRKMIGKLIDFYGSRWEATCAVLAVANDEIQEGFCLPEGFTSYNITKAAPSWEANLEMVGKICADPRYVEPVEEEKPTGGKLEGKSFLFTGTLSMPRKLAEKMVADNGGNIASSVSKNLTYLVAGESAGSKLEKAKKLGIPVLTEQEFAEMLA